MAKSERKKSVKKRTQVKRYRNAQPLERFVFEALRRRPRRVLDVIDLVTKMGYKTDSEHLSVMVRNLLCNRTDLYKRVERGVYTPTAKARKLRRA